MRTFGICLLVTGILSALGFNFSTEKEGRDTAQQIAQSYSADFRIFQEEVNKLAELAQGPFNLPQLRRQLAGARYAYKRVEFLFDYTKGHYNYLFINGAPLPKVDKEDVNGEVVEPNGLQALDELLYSEEALAQRMHIAALAAGLKKSVDFIAVVHLPLSITDPQAVEALRSGVVRVFTLGLTGFDTPGSGDAIEEARASLQAMETAFLYFGDNLEPEAEEKFQEIVKLYRKAQQLLEANADFDTFGRLAFLKQAANPLYAALLDFQELNGIETGQFKYHAQDYRSRNLFDENFLNRDYYSELSYMPLNDAALIKLGKALFYDPVLSANLEMSCASCHDPKLAFADGLPKSKTLIPGRFTQRNAPTLIDAAYSSRYFWDMREVNLERQVAHVVDNNMEFNTNFYEIADRLNQSSAYVRMFEEAYGGVGKKAIYSRSVSNAIAAYVNSLTSFNSAFDRYARNETATYPEDAARGFNLFMGKAACGSCHFAPVFNGSAPPFYQEAESEVLGVTMGFDTLHPQLDPDPGRAENGLKKDARPFYRNSFKTVTVRNAALTAPYMHNGLFRTLEEVMDFYNRGGGAGMGLEVEHQTLPAAPLNLSEREKTDIIAFLHTLTDTSGLTDNYIALPVFEGRPEWNNR